jgi:hypothetical protein
MPDGAGVKEPVDVEDAERKDERVDRTKDCERKWLPRVPLERE